MHATLAIAVPHASQGRPTLRSTRCSGVSAISFIRRNTCSGTLLRGPAAALTPSPAPAASTFPTPFLLAASAAFFFLYISALTVLHSATCFSYSSFDTKLSHTGQNAVEASRLATQDFM